MPKRVFLLFSGSNDRAVFALARVFVQCDAPFAVVAWKQSDPILRSAYRDHVCAVREGNALTFDALQDWVAAARRAHPGARLVIVPSSEYLNTFLLGVDRDVLDRDLDCELPLVDPPLYAELTNKATSTRYFESQGIAVPPVLPNWDEAGLPMVAKPHANVGTDDVVRYPILLHTRRDLAAFLERSDRDAYFPQAFVRGASQYLLAYLARDGTVFASAQANLGQQAQGKSIVLARTSRFHEDPVAVRALSALQARGFHGFAMLEFIVGAEGPQFIELNPRPWGPLQLCADHDCGIVEAFVGDRLHDDPRRHDHIRARKPATARYLWFGGILRDRRAGREIRWQRGPLRGWLGVLRCIGREVYLRSDSWKVFLDEAMGK